MLFTMTPQSGGRKCVLVAVVVVVVKDEVEEWGFQGIVMLWAAGVIRPMGRTTG